MREFCIPKRNGKVRHIVAPDEKEKEMLRGYLEILNKTWVHPCAHGFIEGRSPVTNAMEHVGFDISICMDLEDFFDTVGVKHLEGKVSQEIIDKCLYKGRAAQGLPTSPALSNIAAIDMDKAIIVCLNGFGLKYVYTRYADDLTISFKIPTPQSNFSPGVNDGVTPVKPLKETIMEIIKKVEFTVFKSDFRVNRNKTQVQWACSGKRNICGVLVGDEGIRATKAHRHRLRAIKHLIGTENGQFRGLSEWIKLKRPKMNRGDQKARWKNIRDSTKKKESEAPVAKKQGLPTALRIHLLNDAEPDGEATVGEKKRRKKKNKKE